MWWNRVRYFLTQDTYTTHDLDFAILVTDAFYESPGFTQMRPALLGACKTVMPLHRDFARTHFVHEHNYLCPTGDINSKESLEKIGAISRRDADKLM